MDISKILMNSAALEAGEWVGNIPDYPGVRFRVRGFNSATVTALRDAKMRAIPDAERDSEGGISTEAARLIRRDLLKEVVVLEWDGFSNAGKPLAFTQDLCDQLMSHPDAKKIQDIASWCAQEVDKRNTGNSDMLIKNSVKPSSGD